MSYTARFRKPEGAEKYHAAYEATLALWPVDHEAIDIETSFGTTHVNIAGSPDAPPLILIHGAQISSTCWYANIKPLSQHFRVYAVDVVDQMGMSVPTRKLKTAQDCSDWLMGVLDALNLERVTLVGHSEGGWQTINMALTHPQRVARMVLLCPAPAFTRIRWQVILRMLPIFIMPTPRMFYGYFQWTSTQTWDKDNPHPLVEQFMIGAKVYKPQELSMGVTSVFTDDELRQIDTPTLLLVGDKEVVYKPDVVLERARRLMPHIEAELILNGGHLFPVDQADATNARMLQFLTAS